MNLEAVAAGYITAVNGATSVTLLHCTGYTTGADGGRAPVYAAPITQFQQVQELTQPELRQLDGLNLQGVRQAVYLTGTAAGVVRAAATGGDLLQFNGQVWLVAAVLEKWSGWCKVAAVQQNGS